MQTGQASETAYRAARARARHQVVDDPVIFDDPMALKVLRPEDARAVVTGRGRGSPLARGMRLAIAARHRMAEDALRVAVARGVQQYVVLGAGLDTFAYRAPLGCERVRVYEVDHPQTQAAKRLLVQEAGLPHPLHLRYVPVDFGRDAFWARLVDAGFDPDAPAFFAFLGVSMYLDKGALLDTLDTIAARAARGSELVFDYVVPPERLPWIDRVMLKIAAWRCARLGEPWRTFLDPQELPQWLLGLGYSAVEPLEAAALEAKVRREQGVPVGSKPPRFGMGRMVRAVV